MTSNPQLKGFYYMSITRCWDIRCSGEGLIINVKIRVMIYSHSCYSMGVRWNY